MSATNAAARRRARNAQYLKHETKVWFEITTLLIPGENDSPAEIEAEGDWVIDHLGPDVPLHFTAFHPDWKMTDRPPTPPATLRMARQIAHKAGLRYVYTGNIHDPAGQSTFCHGCGALLIGRDWYDITAWHLSADGRCLACGTPCRGVFEVTAGRWGARRQPLNLYAPPRTEVMRCPRFGRYRGESGRDADIAECQQAAADSSRAFHRQCDYDCGCSKGPPRVSALIGDCR